MLAAKLTHLVHLAGELTVASTALFLLAVTDTIAAALIAAIASVLNTFLIVRSRSEQREEIRNVAAKLEEPDQ